MLLRTQYMSLPHWFHSTKSRYLLILISSGLFFFTYHAWLEYIGYISFTQSLFFPLIFIGSVSFYLRFRNSFMIYAWCCCYLYIAYQSSFNCENFTEISLFVMSLGVVVLVRSFKSVQLWISVITYSLIYLAVLYTAWLKYSGPFSCMSAFAQSYLESTWAIREYQAFVAITLLNFIILMKLLPGLKKNDHE